MLAAFEAARRWRYQDPRKAPYRFKEQNPLQSSYSDRIKDEQWLLHEAVIRSMHASGKTRNQMLDSLRQEHGFCPSIGQLNAQMKKWGLAVYNVDSAAARNAPDSVSADTESEPVSKLDLTERRRMQDWEALRKYQERITRQEKEWYGGYVDYEDVFPDQQQQHFWRDAFPNADAALSPVRQETSRPIKISMPCFQMPLAPLASNSKYFALDFTETDILKLPTDNHQTTNPSQQQDWTNSAQNTNPTSSSGPSAVKNFCGDVADQLEADRHVINGVTYDMNKLRARTASEASNHASGTDDIHQYRPTPRFAVRSPNSQFPGYGSVSSAASSLKHLSSSNSQFPKHGSTSSAASSIRHYASSLASSASVRSFHKMDPDEDPYEGRNKRVRHITQTDYVCGCCPKKPKKFDTKNELRLHEMEKLYSCQYCSIRFKSKIEAERHQDSLHLRRYSWSCATMAKYEAAFHPTTSFAAQTPNGPGSDACGYCGEEFPNHPQPDWQVRLEHLTNVHKIGECNLSKKFYRADHFRQHLKHSHAGRSGKWTNMLESACWKDEVPHLGNLSIVSNYHSDGGSVALSYTRDQQDKSYELLLEDLRKDRLAQDAATTWPPQTPVGGNDCCSEVLPRDVQLESPSELPKTSQHNTCSDVSAQGPGSSERSLGNIKDVGHWEWLHDHEDLRRSVDALGDLEVFENCGVLPELLQVGGFCELSPAILCRTPQKVLDWLAAQTDHSSLLTYSLPADDVYASDANVGYLRGTGGTTVTYPGQAEIASIKRENETLRLKVKALEDSLRRAATDGGYCTTSPLASEMIDFTMFVRSKTTSPVDQTFMDASEGVPDNGEMGTYARRTQARHDISSRIHSSKDFITDASLVPKRSLRVVTSSKSNDSLKASSIKSHESWRFSTVTGMPASP